jgi:hypothetical protein
VKQLVSGLASSLVRIGAALVLAVALTALVACGESSPSAPPSPTSTPAAVSYADPAALYAAIEKAGAPRVDGFGSGQFSEGGSMPAAAHAKRGTFMAAIPSDSYMLSLPDGIPAASMVAAVFPDSASRDVGAAFGQHIASVMGEPSVPQLQGPNWLIWGDEEALRSIQGAIGGALRQSPVITASPGAAS